jgi:hypothetical protein
MKLKTKLFQLKFLCVFFFILQTNNDSKYELFHSFFLSTKIQTDKLEFETKKQLMQTEKVVKNLHRKAFLEAFLKLS